jgi:hypothetical protein
MYEWHKDYARRREEYLRTALVLNTARDACVERLIYKDFSL